MMFAYASSIRPCKTRRTIFAFIGFAFGNLKCVVFIPSYNWWSGGDENKRFLRLRFTVL